VHERQIAGLNALLSLSLPIVTTPAIATPLPAAKKQSGALAIVNDRALRGAFALMFSAGAASALGFVFWAFTAHRQGASAVGAVSAEVSSITFLAAVGGLNLSNIFARFLPVAGWHSRRLILMSYSVAAMAGLLAAGVFLLTPMAARLVQGGEFGRLAFVACVALSSVFNNQDGGLIGFGRFSWVPIENVLVALTRLMLLPLSAVFLSARIAVLWSWALPMVGAILAVNVLIIGPLAGQEKKQRPRLPPFGELSRLVAIGSVTTAIYSAVSAFLPALVTHQLGPRQGGYFYIPWMIATMISLLLTNVSISMVREVVANPEKADFTIRRSLGLAALIITIVLVTCSLLGRLVLAPLGRSFIVHGAPLLQWVGLATPATAVILLFLALCLVRRRPWPAFAVNLTTSGVIVAGVLLLKSHADISRVGMIYCIVQWMAAVVVSWPTFTALRVVRRGRESR
jgi:O-antigen/teichoic acid export membrane protein